MINPSANGWIDKFFLEQQQPTAVADAASFYKSVRDTGFIYGHIIGFDTAKKIDATGWLHDEISKTALLNILYQLFCFTTAQTDCKIFIAKAESFYNHMNPQGFNLFRKMMPGHSASLNLERIIDERVHTNDNIISKNFSHIVTNALLFVDVLAFQQYLIHGEIPEKYLKKIE